MAGGIAIAIAALRDRLGLGSSEEDAAETEQARLETETQQSAAAPQEEEKPSTSGKEKERVFVSGPEGFTFYDVFFWRDAPDWYRKTWMATGFGLSYCILKQYMNRHELEVFMPPRSVILPERMQKGYRNSQMLKYGFLKVGREATVIACAAASYYAGAYYLGEYREAHTWHNFAASGAVAGSGCALWLIRPLKARPVVFGAALGTLLGATGASIIQSLGVPFWETGHDFEGWFFGQKVNLKKAREPRPVEVIASQ